VRGGSKPRPGRTTSGDRATSADRSATADGAPATIELAAFRAGLMNVSAHFTVSAHFRKIPAAAVGAVCILYSVFAPVQAGLGTGPFYCGSKIIYVGMLRSEVLKYCGEPTSKMVDDQRVRSPNNQVLGYSHVERWKYESYSMTRRLIFVDDKLQAIERW
jgi:hypothetical protein